MNKTYITSAVRTAVGSLGKSLKNVKAEELGSAVITESIIRSKINKDDVDEVIFGQVLTGGREGVVGINYDLKGPLSNLKVEVNPLSILVPEVLKEIVSVRSTR